MEKPPGSSITLLKELQKLAGEQRYKHWAALRPKQRTN
jgi:hypothetical protein